MDLSRRDFLAAGAGAVGAGAVLGGGVTNGRFFRELVARAADVAPAGSDLGAIEHVVILVQENRSFDHYFGTYPGVLGFDDHKGTRLGPFAQKSVDGTTILPFHLDVATSTPLCAGNVDIPDHDWVPQHLSWNNGKLDRFVRTHEDRAFDGPAQGALVMSYFTREDLPFYFGLADAFTICDQYFCSVIGPTMPNRLYSLSATIDPDGEAGGPVVETPGFHNAKAALGSVRWETMYERLLDDGISWKFYQPPGSSVGNDLALSTGFNALLYFEQYLADPTSELYKRAFLPVWPDEFVADVQNDTLPQISYLLPPVVDSEHPSAPPTNGEVFVSSVISTLLAKPEVWAKTVVFLVYDENGGFFDHVVPPVPPKKTKGEWITADLPDDAGTFRGPIGLGFRVPAMVISPFSRGGHVNSDVFDHTSLLKFLETRFGTKVPNLSDWRNKTVGDLTSTVDLKSSDVSAPKLPPLDAQVARMNAECPANQSPTLLLAPPPPLQVPRDQVMPTQEKG